MELEKPKKVTVVETIPIERPTLGGLIDAIKAAYDNEYRFSSLQYNRGEALVVERQVPSDLTQGESQFLTPYEMIRQHTDMDVWVREGELPMEIVLLAVQHLSIRGYEVTTLVYNGLDSLVDWFEKFHIDHISKAKLYEDFDCPRGCFCVAGSKTGKLLGHLEVSVVCKLQENSDGDSRPMLDIRDTTPEV